MCIILHFVDEVGHSDAVGQGGVLSHVAANLKRLRSASGLSQDALAKASGLSRRHLLNLEAGDTNVMLPTAMGFGEGAEFRQPMAVGVIGGLISSTLLSLVLVPVVYEIVDDFENWLAPKLGRLITRPPADALAKEANA